MVEFVGEKASAYYIFEGGFAGIRPKGGGNACGMVFAVWFGR